MREYQFIVKKICSTYMSLKLNKENYLKNNNNLLSLEMIKNMKPEHFASNKEDDFDPKLLIDSDSLIEEEFYKSFQRMRDIRAKTRQLSIEMKMTKEMANKKLEMKMKDHMANKLRASQEKVDKLKKK